MGYHRVLEGKMAKVLSGTKQMGLVAASATATLMAKKDRRKPQMMPKT